MTSPRYVLAVGALVRDACGRILVLQRPTTARRFPGQWEPPGGKTESGEEIGISVRREVEEEAGLQVALDSVAGCSEFELPDRRVAVLYFHVRTLAGEARVSDEHAALRWVTPAELQSLRLTPAFRRFVESTGCSI